MVDTTQTSKILVYTKQTSKNKLRLYWRLWLLNSELFLHTEKINYFFGKRLINAEKLLHFDFKTVVCYWASAASPTLGCSIEISRDIYMYNYVHVSVVCQITWNHVNQTRACSKSVLGGKIGPVTPVLFFWTIR